MFERDYLLRLLTQAGLMLGKVTRLREENKQQEALDLIDEYLGRELRLRSRLAMGLSDEDLLAMLSVTGSPNAESVAVVAAFLQEEGELLSDLGRTEESVPRFSKALRLSLFLLRNGEEIEGWDISLRVERILRSLSEYQLDALTLRVLRDWRELNGEYMKAEDLLYELYEQEGVSPQEGDDFYDRLAIIDCSLLEKGGLTQEELEEGRRQWNALTKENT